ncbi:hypothetical protein IQ244_25410 [Nostoc sp. LEGE 06077]|uniref:hypothetical protein n=1 Tax=Nostoc sp. LEGE 06077 TaxID=915325 RepID=UPI00187FBED5|nr:hypothetical protein [Nostoc sp. LEGE 06077]MBE9209772.1 hypothetical protein [Nostoc sp. LEGE 06077]
MKNTLHKDFNVTNKPIGYFTSTMPGDNSYLDELQQQYGSTFEQLGKVEKLLLLHGVVQNLLSAEINVQGGSAAVEALSTVSPIVQGIHKRVKIGEHLGLAEALINQLKYQR